MCSKQKGFNLVEVLIATFLVSVLVLSVAALMPVSSSLRGKADYYSKATNLAQIIFERLRTLEYNQLTYEQLLSLGLIQGRSDDGSNPNRFVGTFRQVTLTNGVIVDLTTYLPRGEGSIEVITLVDGNGRSLDMKSLIVRINWQEKNRQTRQIALGTIIPRLR